MAGSPEFPPAQDPGDPGSPVAQEAEVQGEVPAGTQVSPAVGAPMMVIRDADGNTVGIPLDPVTGAPMGEDRGGE